MNGAVVAAGYEQIADFVDGQASGIDQRSYKGLDAVVGGYFVERNGDALSARSAEGHINISKRVDPRIAHGMEIVGDLEANGYGIGLALVFSGGDAHDAAGGTIWHAGDEALQRHCLARVDEGLASASPKRTSGRA